VAKTREIRTLAGATPDQLSRLATALLRQDRFSEGSLGADFASGLMAAIARRAAVLAESTPDDDPDRDATA
jgi:hypothetical protein